MGRRTVKDPKSYTLPPSPSHSHSFSSLSSSSSSDFEFTISNISPRKSSTADELFYKGQLLPLHPSPRISMVRTLLLSSTSTSTSSARNSTSSSNDSHSSFTTDLALFPDSDSSRPSSASATEEDDFKRLHNPNNGFYFNTQVNTNTTNKYFSFSRFSSVFRPKTRDPGSVYGSSVKRMSNTAKEVVRKYLKKVKPLFDKLSQQRTRTERSMKETEVSGKSSGCGRKQTETTVISHSFSGNLRYPLRKRSYVSSCPSSMRSSPSHSGMLSRSGLAGAGGTCHVDTSSVEELQSAVQGAIAHCKNSLIQNKTMMQFLPVPGSD